MKHVRAALVSTILVFALSGCAFNVDSLATFETDGVQASTATYSGVPLTSGQIVVAGKDSAWNMLVALFAAQYSEFGHSGIVSVEGDKAYVYEALVSLRPYLRGPPTRAMNGRIRRTPLRTFLSRHDIVAIYNPAADVNRESVAAYAAQQFRKKTAFDPYFDSTDAERVYCNEFVAQALEFAGSEPISPTPATENVSVQRLLKWLEIDMTDFLLVKDILANAERTVILSKELSPSQIVAHFSLRRELHRRFTAGQKPGNLFSWSISGLRYRPGVTRYLREGVASTGDAAQPEIEKSASDLANLLLGPFSIQASVAARQTE